MAIASGWRTLAEPAYGISENGRQNMLPAGTRLRLVGSIPDMSPVAGADTALVKTGPGTTVAWYVTAEALRFVEAG